jgi:hypothetical protein
MSNPDQKSPRDDRKTGEIRLDEHKPLAEIEWLDHESPTGIPTLDYAGPHKDDQAGERLPTPLEAWISAGIVLLWSAALIIGTEFAFVSLRYGGKSDLAASLGLVAPLLFCAGVPILIVCPIPIVEVCRSMWWRSKSATQSVRAIILLWLLCFMLALLANPSASALLGVVCWSLAAYGNRIWRRQLDSEQAQSDR